MMDARPWPLRRLGLKVLDLPVEVDYYARLGLRRLEADATHALFGFGPVPVLELTALPGRRPRPPRSAGLFHFALLLPSALDLGGFLLRCSELGIPLDGASDHLVSQALYLSDPEGNGIEVYADRPTGEWTWDGGQIRMATQPLDLESLMKQAPGVLDAFPETSRLGHMHITSGDLTRSLDFYQELGMDLVAGMGDYFRFASWERYHHHLGINLMSGPNAARVREEEAGLAYFEIERADLEPGELLDPDGIKVRVTA